MCILAKYVTYQMLIRPICLCQQKEVQSKEETPSIFQCKQLLSLETPQHEILCMEPVNVPDNSQNGSSTPLNKDKVNDIDHTQQVREKARSFFCEICKSLCRLKLTKNRAKVRRKLFRIWWSQDILSLIDWTQKL